jgi:UPF0755 protein
LRNRRIQLLLLAAAALAALLAYLEIFHGGNVFTGARQIPVYVSRGLSFSDVVDTLEAKGVIRSRFMFTLVAWVSGGRERIRAGKYVFTSGMSNEEIFLALRSGQGAEAIVVTIPEGYRATVHARILRAHLGIDSAEYMRLVFDKDFIQSLDLEVASLEGYLLPDTYSFSWQQDEQEVIREQVREFQRFFVDSLVERASAIGWSVHQVVTFASIVEGEALMDEERSVIAGVYMNRLRRGMRLEADPTIQYILEDGPRRLLYADLRRDSPYNTYRYAGLPPGPINNPGRKSMLAALYPAQHDYLYFVANTRGGHWFARSYPEHQANVRRYRRDRTRPPFDRRSATG